MGYFTAWSRYGKVKWEYLFLPTIRLLKEGFPVGADMAKVTRYMATTLKESESFR